MASLEVRKEQPKFVGISYSVQKTTKSERKVPMETTVITEGMRCIIFWLLAQMLS